MSNHKTGKKKATQSQQRERRRAQSSNSVPNDQKSDGPNKREEADKSNDASGEHVDTDPVIYEPKNLKVRADLALGSLNKWQPLIAILATGISALVLVAVFVQAGIYWGQLDAAKKGLAEAVKTREVENRAYVFMNFIQFDNSPVSDKPIHLLFRFENTGKTPALDVKVRINEGIETVGLSAQTEQAMKSLDKQLPELIKKGYWTDEVAILPSGMRLPNASGSGALISTGARSDGRFTEEEIARMSAVPGERFHVWGTIQYCDIFGRRWNSEFCFYNFSADSADFDFCPTHNRYEEDTNYTQCAKPK